MIRITDHGYPVVWMHQNFSQCEPEFPIKPSNVSELIFVKKVKATFNDIFIFPKNIEIESKAQLLCFL